MSVENEQAEVQTEEEELASALAGYGGTAREDNSPAEQSNEEELQSEVEEPIAGDPPIEQAPPELTVAEELKALKDKVSALASNSDPDAVRRLHGEIGNINRSLQNLAKPAKVEEAPVDDELTAAIKEAETAAEEFPELVGPLVKALKLSQARQQPAAQPENIDERVSTAVSRVRQMDAIEALKEEHPDYETVRATPEYKTWLASKTPEFQQKFLNTWNPAVVSKGLSEFKDSLRTQQDSQQSKKNRLESAVVTRGVQQKAGPTKLPDEEGYAVGYYKGGKKR